MSELDRRFLAIPRDVRLQMAKMMTRVARIQCQLVDAEDEETVDHLTKEIGVLSLSVTRLQAEYLGIKLEILSTSDAFSGGRVAFRIDGTKGDGE
jgi:hypothetical protein